jgi:hypothetical protein
LQAENSIAEIDFKRMKFFYSESGFRNVLGLQKKRLNFAKKITKNYAIKFSLIFSKTAREKDLFNRYFQDQEKG